MNMMVRVIAKMACSSRELMAGSDLQYYLTWLKDQLKAPGRKWHRNRFKIILAFMLSSHCDLQAYLRRQKEEAESQV